MNPQSEKLFFLVDRGLALQSIVDLMEGLGWKPVDIPTKAHAIIYPGGQDVNPSYYGDIKHPSTFYNDKNDARWSSMFGHFRTSRYLKIGICRGAQFLNIVNGGKLWQDVDGHRGMHEIFYVAKNGDKFLSQVTSTHHQMMRPTRHGELWGYARRSSYRDMGMDRKRKADWQREGPDPEIVFYPGTKSLCFQPHPEYHNQETVSIFSLALERAEKEYWPFRQQLKDK